MLETSVGITVYRRLHPSCNSQCRNPRQVQKSNFFFQTLQLSELAELARTCRNLRNLPELAGTCGTCQNLPNLPELVGLVGTVGTFGLWSIFHVPLATSRRFCFHTDLPYQPQPPAPLQPTGGKHLMFALFCRNFPRTCRNCRKFWVVVTFSRSPGHLATLLLPH